MCWFQKASFASSYFIRWNLNLSFISSRRYITGFHTGFIFHNCRAFVFTCHTSAIMFFLGLFRALSILYGMQAVGNVNMNGARILQLWLNGCQGWPRYINCVFIFIFLNYERCLFCFHQATSKLMSTKIWCYLSLYMPCDLGTILVMVDVSFEKKNYKRFQCLEVCCASVLNFSWTSNMMMTNWWKH